MLFSANQKIVFIGDSITDCNCMTTAAPYGDGYVCMLHNLLTARYPELNLNIVNKGVAGNSVRNLDQRWEQDVIAQKPDWLVVMVGINDAYQILLGNHPQGVPLDEYQATLRRLLQRAKATGTSRFILAQPYIIEPDRNQPIRQLMDVYGQTMANLAPEFGATLVKTQEAFDTALKSQPATFWSPDRFHPPSYSPGHAVIALAFLRAIGFTL